jgi:hypothetical protein
LSEAPSASGDEGNRHSRREMSPFSLVGAEQPKRSVPRRFRSGSFSREDYGHQGDADTLFRIHGTNQPENIGRAVSSGCIRMTNEDVIDLYDRVKTGAIVVVLAPKQVDSPAPPRNAGTLRLAVSPAGADAGAARR